ncbi:hypothetical protein L486_06847 [Kwoniella mangroviensis CBS 10435]|uniref:Uncharacterized protein n=1 Tax=Kwoniella mangroviensis CBS 10435 TaxID=1331196 RepID=A0A1B9IJ04_9TREE|nr:hypothetical protein L486_06847 [Kwoniella mangroviensis CBS 10435]
MPIPLTTSRSLSKRNKPHTLIREPTFYQEAYLASFLYIQAIGNQLKRDWGFREINEGDVARLHPFIQTDKDELLLNLISPSTIHHIIQLPLSLLSLPHGVQCHIRLSTFSTVLTSTYTHVTPSTYDIPPLKDLISFLQCLLPSSDALSLSLSPPLGAIGRCSGTSEDMCDGPRPDEGRENDKEKDKLISIDSWRQDIEVMCPPPPRIATPSPRWLDRNEDMLRDTVGCGYYRRLREVAEDHKVNENEYGLVQIHEVLIE